MDRLIRVHRRSLKKEPLLDNNATCSTTPVGTTSFLDFLHYPLFRRQLTLCFMVWSSCGLCFVAMLFLTPTMHPNPFLSFTLFGAVDFGGYIILFFTLERVGRRGTMAIALLVCAALCFLLIYEDESKKLIYALTAKIFNIVAFGTIYIYVGEIFPTVFRGKAVAIISSFSQVSNPISVALVPRRCLSSDVFVEQVPSTL